MGNRCHDIARREMTLFTSRGTSCFLIQSTSAARPPNYSNFYSTQKFVPWRAVSRFCVTVQNCTTSTIWPNFFVTLIPRKLYFPAGWLQKVLREVVFILIKCNYVYSPCVCACRFINITTRADSLAQQIMVARHRNPFWRKTSLAVPQINCNQIELATGDRRLSSRKKGRHGKCSIRVAFKWKCLLFTPYYLINNFSRTSVVNNYYC